MSTTKPLRARALSRAVSILIFLCVAATDMRAADAVFRPGEVRRDTAGNPVFPGWYADPEGVVYGNEYWIYPTFSAAYNQQVFFDAFSSPDLVNWTKHSRILDTNAITWARRAMWAPADRKSVV